MNAAEHYAEAERELMPDGGCEYGCPHAGCTHELAHIARAQVHALLAIVAGKQPAAIIHVSGNLTPEAAAALRAKLEAAMSPAAATTGGERAAENRASAPALSCDDQEAAMSP